MSKEALMSKNKLREYEQELEYLKTTKRKEIAEVIKEARSHGDLSENSEYDEAKNTQALMESRIAEIESILQNAKVIDEDELSTEHVGIGCTIKVKDLEFDEVEDFALVSSGESDPMANKISDESPIGAALLGAHVGDVIDVTTPSGAVIRYEVLEIGKQNFG